MKEELEYKGGKMAKFKAFFYFAGWGIGLASLLLAVYSEFIKKDEPRLEYDIVSSTTFINKNETAANLKIFIDSLDIQKKDLNITAFNIKVSNKGTAPIRYNDYDQGFFGLKIQHGALLESPTLIEESVKQIKELFPKGDSILNNKIISIPSLSLDVDDYYIMHIVLLHSADSIPEFHPEGRIIGQKEISLNTLKNPITGFWALVFIGDWYVHLARLFLYLIIVIISALLVGLSYSEIDTFYHKKKLERLISRLSEKYKIPQYIKEDVVKYGVSFVMRLNEIYSKKEEDLSSQYKRSKEIVTSKRQSGSKKHRNFWFYKQRYNMFHSMANKGYIELKDDGSVVINKEAKRSIQIVYSNLSSKNMLKPNYTEIYYGGDSYDPLTGELI